MNRRAKLVLLGFALAALISPTMVSAQMALPQAGIIDTISGNGFQGFSGDGGPALQASFGWLTGVTVDAAGNIYLLDGTRIREIASSTGVVNTVASVKGASGIAVDALGNIYVSSVTTIQKVAMPDKIITTITGTDGKAGYSGDGGPAVQAQINGASKVAIDALGNIYFADIANNRIRKIAGSTGQISTVAGTGVAGFSGDGCSAIAAQLNGPGDVAIDPSGNLFIEDLGNYRIREIAAASGVITTIGGTGIFGFSGDGGPALSAQFGQLTGIALDGQGNLYLADYNNNRVRAIATSTGLISTVAGNGTAGLGGDDGPALCSELETIYGIAVDHSGYLYILNSGVGVTRAVGPGVAQSPSSYSVTLTSSDPKPRMGEYVTLTAKVISNLGLPALSGTVKWYIGSTLIGTSSPDGTGTTTIVTELADAGDVTVTASYTGDLSGYGTLAIPVFGYALIASPNGPMTITEGKSGQIAINVGAFHGFKGPVDLSCAGLPFPGDCKLSTSNVDLSDTAATQVVTLTVHTQNPTVAKANLDSRSGLMIAIFCPLLLLLTRVRRVRRHLYGFILAILGLGISAALSACSGSSIQATATPSTPSKSSNTLPAGTYALTVNAASGNESTKLPITVIVQ